MIVLYVIILTKLFDYIWSYWVYTLFIMRAAYYMHLDITDTTVIASLILKFNIKLLNINVVIYIIRIMYH